MSESLGIHELLDHDDLKIVHDIHRGYIQPSIADEEEDQVRRAYLHRTLGFAVGLMCRGDEWQRKAIIRVQHLGLRQSHVL